MNVVAGFGLVITSAFSKQYLPKWYMICFCYVLQFIDTTSSKLYYNQLSICDDREVRLWVIPEWNSMKC
jgi:hypothetical protein